MSIDTLVEDIYSVVSSKEVPEGSNLESKAYVNVSVSGGRTSAYMAYMMLTNKEKIAEHIGEKPENIEYIFTFANTGMEHDDTLRFMNDVDNKLLGGSVVWLESNVFHGERVASGHKIVTYDTCYRNKDWTDEEHPFHSAIRKYGIPNVSMKWCTRELKLNPINSYFKSLGLSRQRNNCDLWTALGIREDESRRVSKNADVEKIIYPLVDIFPADKQDVLDWFSQFDWDLQIPEYLGNCVTCYKKSFKKLKQVYVESPSSFEFSKSMEQKYGFIGAEFEKHGVQEPRVFYRSNMSTQDLISLFDITANNQLDFISAQKDAGCSESCEMFETEQV